MKSSLSLPDMTRARVFPPGTYKGRTIYLLIIQPAAASLVITSDGKAGTECWEMADNKVGNGAAHLLSGVTSLPLFPGKGSSQPSAFGTRSWLRNYTTALNQNKRKHPGLCLASCGLVN